MHDYTVLFYDVLLEADSASCRGKRVEAGTSERENTPNLNVKIVISNAKMANACTNLKNVIFNVKMANTCTNLLALDTFG